MPTSQSSASQQPHPSPQAPPHPPLAPGEFPSWFPTPEQWKVLGAALGDHWDRDCATVIEETYRDLVLNAANPLQRTAARSLTHVIWLEILSECMLATNIKDLISGPSSDKPRSPTGEASCFLDNYLDLVKFKNGSIRLLAMLQKLDGVSPPRSAPSVHPPEPGHIEP